MTLFADVVAASEEIAGSSSRSAKTATLAGLLSELDPAEVPITVGFLTGVPRQGRIGVGYATAYGVDEDHANEPSLTIEDIDSAIAAVQDSVGEGSAGRRRDILGDVFGRATKTEADFLRRLFTGELRQGALGGVMLDAIAKASGAPGDVVRRAAMLSGDPSFTAATAMTSGEQGLRDIGFEIFRPILPMLASTSESAADAVGGFDLASVEWKLDGIRIQVHRRDDEIRIYTRGLNDITGSLPGVVDAVRRLPVRQAVLDGEALWMEEGSPGSFQETVKRIDRDAPPEGIETFLFDLLHVDGEDLLDMPLHERARSSMRSPRSCGSRRCSPPIRMKRSRCSTRRWTRDTKESSSRTRRRCTLPAGAVRRGAR